MSLTPMLAGTPKHFPFSREGLGWLGWLPLAWFSYDASLAPDTSVALLTDDVHFYKKKNQSTKAFVYMVDFTEDVERQRGFS